VVETRNGCFNLDLSHRAALGFRSIVSRHIRRNTSWVTLALTHQKIEAIYCLYVLLSTVAPKGVELGGLRQFAASITIQGRKGMDIVSFPSTRTYYCSPVYRSLAVTAIAFTPPIPTQHLLITSHAACRYRLLSFPHEQGNHRFAV